MAHMWQRACVCVWRLSARITVCACVCACQAGRWHMKRLPSCSFIFFSAVVWPGRGAVVTSPWKIKLYAATGRLRDSEKERERERRKDGKDRKFNQTKEGKSKLTKNKKNVRRDTILALGDISRERLNIMNSYAQEMSHASSTRLCLHLAQWLLWWWPQ